MIRDFFTTNIWLKLASLLLAVALWFFVILSGRTGTSMEIPVMYINLPGALEVLDSQKTVTVRIEGQERLLENIKYNDLSAVIDLRGVKAGTSFFPVTPDDIKIPSAFKVISVQPEKIKLTIENQLKKSVQVKPSIIGLPAKDFAIVEIKVKPEMVMIEGPRRIISHIYSIQTEPIDITGINKELIFDTELNLTGLNIQKDIKKVKVTISVKKIE